MTDLPSVPVFLLNYAMHSTLLILAVWLILRLGRHWRLHEQELLWRCALLGSLLTSGAQTLSGGGPFGSAVELRPSILASPSVATVLSPEADAPFSAQNASHPAGRRAERGLAREPRGARRLHWSDSQRSTLTGVWIGGLGLALGVWWLAWRRLQGTLHDRRALPAGPLHAELSDLLARAGWRHPVRLTLSDTLSSPITFGVWQAEICVPARALQELNSAEFRALLAHEVCHLKRRDPLWLHVHLMLRSLLFFQPLLRPVTARLRKLAELSCDHWAGEQCPRSTDLARCLAKVAGWLRRDDRPAPVVAMAESRSELEERVEAILVPNPVRERSGPPVWRGASVMTGAVLLAGFCLPGISEATDHQAPPTLPKLSSSALSLEILELVADVQAELEITSRDIHTLRQWLDRTLSAPDLIAQLTALEQRETRLRTLVQNVASCLASAPAAKDRSVATPPPSSPHQEPDS